ncbi:MAG: cellulase family glycosylhydrolase [Clostridia bacterium]
MAAEGRRLFLRGVNANGLIDYPADYQESLPLSAQDFLAMAALGFNLVRLPVSWGRIMPEPGRPDPSSIHQVTTMVDLAWTQHIYVLVDFHQDNYACTLGPGRESDGAPDWAVVGQRRWNWRMSGNPAVQTTWSHFWNNAHVHGQGLHAHYFEAVTAMVEPLVNHPGVLAYDLMNEPDRAGRCRGASRPAICFRFTATPLSGSVKSTPSVRSCSSPR